MDINFENVSEEDQILIRTQNSEYRFSVTDPAARSGILTGGSLGEQTRESILVGAVQENRKSITGNASRLNTGARALFYLTAKSGLERLITSPIVDLVHLKNRSGGRRAA